MANQFVPFATGSGANVLTPSAFAADARTANGNQPGIASSALTNTALRQATSITAAFAQFLANQTGDSLNDDGIQSELLATMQKILGGPTGEIKSFAGASAPTGFLLCQGQAIARTGAYANLFAVIGTTWGAGDGSTTFNIPDLRGLFLRGAGTGTVGGTTYAGTLGQRQNDTTKKNGLALTDPGHVHGYSGNPNSAGGATPAQGSGTIYGPQNINTNSATTGITLGSGDAETRPANACVNFIIKT